MRLYFGPVLGAVLLLKGGENNPAVVLGDTIENYPNCHVYAPEYIGDGHCDGRDFNKVECGWDGGDCTVEGYPDCHVDSPSLLGDGNCDIREYNTIECGWDGGDCLVDGYPDCHVKYPNHIGNGVCDSWIDGADTFECGWDAGDCIIDAYPDCHIEGYDRVGDWRENIGDGVCDGYQYNTAECGWDGGDCDAENAVLWETYPDCTVGIHPEYFGNGSCDIWFNTAECGWDGGDCVVPGYPDCHVENPNNIGDGHCVDREDKYGFNTVECGWEGGDCIEYNKLNPPPGWPGHSGNVVSPQDKNVEPRAGSGDQDVAVPLDGNGARTFSPSGMCAIGIAAAVIAGFLDAMI